MVGLIILFNEYSDKLIGFTQDSGRKMFSALCKTPESDEFIKTIRHQWVFSKMTNMNDAE